MKGSISSNLVRIHEAIDRINKHSSDLLKIGMELQTIRDLTYQTQELYRLDLDLSLNQLYKNG